MEKIISRVLILWIGIIIAFVSSLSKNVDEEQANYYKFGPNDSLIILGIKMLHERKIKRYIVLHMKQLMLLLFIRG